MNALTLTQPWATLVALGHKRVETRSWSTSYTGPLAIHAAKGFPRIARDFAAAERTLGRVPERMPLSAIVATCVLVACRPTEVVALRISGLERYLGDYTSGRWAFELGDIQELLEPVFCRGMLGLWTLPRDVEAEVVAGLKGGV
jgi:hypothetical protein